MRVPPLVKRYLIVFLGRVLTAAFYKHFEVFILRIEPVITFVMRVPPLEKRYLIVFLGRVLTAVFISILKFLLWELNKSSLS